MDSRIRSAAPIGRAASSLALGLLIVAAVLVFGRGGWSGGPSVAVSGASGTASVDATRPDIPVPDGYRLVGAGNIADTVIAPSAVIDAAREAYPTSVGRNPVARFVVIERTDRGDLAVPTAAWVVVSTGALFPTFGDAQTRSSSQPRFAKTLGWVFLDPAGLPLGATVLGYRDEVPPTLPAG